MGKHWEPKGQAGPGKPKSPAWAAVLKDQQPKIVAKQEPVMSTPSTWYGVSSTYINIAMSPNISAYGADVIQASGTGWTFYSGQVSVGTYSMQAENADSQPQYRDVARALGFSGREVMALVHANDRGMSFADIADLIDAHPPIYGPARTELRRQEEAAWLKLVAEKLAGPPPPATEAPF